MDFLSAFGGAAAVVVGLLAWLGRVHDQRIARAEQLKIDSAMERLRAEIEELREDRFDAVVRRRDVYSRLVTSMRVFIDSARPASDADKKAFLAVYDESCVWASEPVIESLGLFLDLTQRSNQAPGSVTESERKTAYTRCILEMRRDVGFPNSEFTYRFVKFR